MADASPGKKRELMEITRRLIPMMEEEEISKIAIVCNEVINRLIKEGRVSED